MSPFALKFSQMSGNVNTYTLLNAHEYSYTHTHTHTYTHTSTHINTGALDK